VTLAWASLAAGDGPLRVVETSERRLAIEVRIEPDDGAPQLRTIVLERPEPAAAWRVAEGLAEGETLGPPFLRFAVSEPDLAPMRVVDATIGDQPADAVTIVDLPDGDAAICLWREGVVRQAWFLDRFLPDAVAAAGDPDTPSPTEPFFLACANSGPAVHVRACSIACFESTRGTIAGKRLAGHAAKPGETPDGPDRREAVDAALDFGQPLVRPRSGPTLELYRWIVGEAMRRHAASRPDAQSPPSGPKDG